MSVVDAFECYMMVGDRALASSDFQVAANNYNLALQSANVDNNINILISLNQFYMSIIYGEQTYRFLSKTTF